MNFGVASLFVLYFALSSFLPGSEAVDFFETSPVDTDYGIFQESEEDRNKRFEPFSNGDQYFGEKRFDPMVQSHLEPYTDLNVYEKRFDTYIKKLKPHAEKYEPSIKRIHTYAKQFESKKTNPNPKYFDQYSKRLNTYIKRFNPLVEEIHSDTSKFDVYTKRFNTYIKRFEPYADRYDSIPEQFDSYTKKFDPYTKKFDPYSKRFDPYTKRFDPYLKRSDNNGGFARQYWISFEQNKRNIIDPQAFHIGFGK